MDRFMKRPANGETSSSTSKKTKKNAKQSNIFTAFRAQEFKIHYYEIEENCSVKPATLSLITEKAINLPATEKHAQLRMNTTKAAINHRTEAELERKELAVDLCKAMLKANTPLEKLSDPAFRDSIERRILGGGAIP